jgi:DNA helicase HerA-like ATPase
VRLIRSKGVGVYFVTQNPLDIPEKVLGQLGNRVQHALRAFTPRDQKAVNSVAETMRPNPKIDMKAAIMELGVGEALISLLDAKGTPSITERAFVVPPGSQIGPITPDERKQLIASSVVAGVYEKAVDRESAFEMLKQRAEGQPTATGGMRGRPEGIGKGTAAPAQDGGVMGSISDMLFGSTGPRGGRREGVVDAVAKSAARTVGSSLARELTRGVLGSLLGGKRR